MMSKMVQNLKKLPRWALVLLGVVVILIIYWIVRSLVIYTEDAYVTVDSVSVASQLQGRVVTVYVRNNQAVTAGQPLLDIDPTPFQLALSISQSNLLNAQKGLLVLTSQIAEADANIHADQAQLAYLQQTQTRDQKLIATGAITQDALDKINSEVAVQNAKLRKDQASKITLQNTYQQQLVVVQLMQHKVDLAQYDLTQTHLLASQAGTIASFRTYVGAYLNVGDPLFTLVTNSHWRVVANIKEYDLSHLYPGQTVWIYLSSHPFRLYRGQVHSIARGVARDDTPSGALEYVDPTVDWIRYDYRFPVTITFDSDLPTLYMGEDARIWIF